MASRWEARVLGALGLGLLGWGLGGCAPGYMKASELERNEQGPAACSARCEELGMRMAALVLVSDTLPGCVCQPLVKQEQPSVPGLMQQPAVPATTPAAPAPSGAGDVSSEGASAATTGFVVIAAAAAAQRAQQQRQQQQSHAQQH